MLLFSQMTRALDVIQDYLDLRSIPHLRLDGTTKSEDRHVLPLTFWNQMGPDGDINFDWHLPG